MKQSLRTRAHVVADATRKTIANPEDTSQVFRIAEALSFGAPGRIARKFSASPSGARLVRDRDDIQSLLSDRARLEAMPGGSLAHAYLQFLDSEGVTAAGLVEASERGSSGMFEPGHTADDDTGWVQRRIRDTHDLWHAVTGYKGDLLGEISLLAFTFAQTRHPGIGFLAGLGLAFASHPGQRRLVTDGYRRGRRAEWLPAQDWAALLPLPLDEVRKRLRVGPPPAYEPVREMTGAASRVAAFAR